MSLVSATTFRPFLWALLPCLCAEEADDANLAQPDPALHQPLHHRHHSAGLLGVGGTVAACLVGRETAA